MTKFKVVFKGDCGFCKKAVEELLKRKHSVELIDVSDNQPLREAHSLKNNRWPTVPMISVYNDEKSTEEFIGGYTDLMKYFDGKKYQHTAD